MSSDDVPPAVALRLERLEARCARLRTLLVLSLLLGATGTGAAGWLWMRRDVRLRSIEVVGSDGAVVAEIYGRDGGGHLVLRGDDARTMLMLQAVREQSAVELHAGDSEGTSRASLSASPKNAALSYLIGTEQRDSKSSGYIGTDDAGASNHLRLTCEGGRLEADLDPAKPTHVRLEGKEGSVLAVGDQTTSSPLDAAEKLSAPTPPK